MINLKLTKYFTEPEEKYICLTACLFIKKKNIRNVLVDKKYQPENFSKKNNLYNYIKTLTKISDSLINGYYPDNFYLRLYYNDKIIKNKKYNDLLNILKENTKIQLVKYEVNNLFDHLIGTLIRFYTFFDDESKNIEYSISIDIDMFLNKKFIDIFNNFRKTNKLVYGLIRLYYNPEHNGDNQSDSDFFNFIFLIANCIIVKKDKIFKTEYWDKYFINMYEQNDLMYILNYNTFKSFTFNFIRDKNIKNIKTFTSFNYGTDEIWINFVLKKILLINNSKNMLDVYLCNTKYLFSNERGKSYEVIMKMKLYFTYNNSVNNNIFKYFINDCNFLKNKSYNELLKYIDNLADYFKYNDNKDSIKILLLFYKNIKNNKYFDLIYMDNHIKYIINNYNFLYKKIKKYSMLELTE
jgi:hypothetical protein